MTAYAKCITPRKRGVKNGAVFNTAGNGWFVPIDAMVLHRLDKNWVVAVGASKQVVQTYQQYDWSTYAKISFNF